MKKPAAAQSIASEVTYSCVTCGATHAAPPDNPLALLKLCHGCGEKRYRKGKAEQRKALASEGEQRS